MAGSRNRSDSTPRVVGPPSSISSRNRNEKFIDTSTQKRNIIILYIYIYLDRTDASPQGYEGSVFILRLTRPLCPVFTRDGSKDPCGGEVPRGWITRLLSPVDSYRNLYTLPGQISHLVSPSSGIHYLDMERGDPGQIGLLLLELVCQDDFERGELLLIWKKICQIKFGSIIYVCVKELLKMMIMGIYRISSEEEIKIFKQG